MSTIIVWWVVLGYFPTSCGAVLAVAALNGPYSYRGRHAAPGRRRARTSTWEQAAGVFIDTPEVRVARVKVEAVADAMLTRSRLWNEGRTGTELAEAYLGIDNVEPVAELERHEGSAGSPAYLGLTGQAVGVASVPLERRDVVARRIDTAEMTIRFGAELGPALARGAEVDEWADPEPMALPDEDGDDPGTGRHTRRRRGRVEAGVT